MVPSHGFESLIEQRELAWPPSDLLRSEDNRYRAADAAICAHLTGRGGRGPTRWGRGRPPRLLEFGDVILLPHRIIPATGGRIDLILITPSGVYLVERRTFRGRAHIVRPGPLTHLEPPQLFVGRRNCADVVEAIDAHMAGVQTVMAASEWLLDVPLRPVLSLSAATFHTAAPLTLDQLVIASPEQVATLIRSDVVMDSPLMKELALMIADRLPPR